MEPEKYQHLYGDRPITSHTPGQARLTSRPGGLAVSELLNPYGGGVGRYSTDTEHPNQNVTEVATHNNSSGNIQHRTPYPTRPSRTPRPRQPDLNAWSPYEQAPPLTVTNQISHLISQPQPHTYPLQLPRHLSQQTLQPYRQLTLVSSAYYDRPATHGNASSQPRTVPSGVRTSYNSLYPEQSLDLNLRAQRAYALSPVIYPDRSTGNSAPPLRYKRMKPCLICTESFCIDDEVDHFPHKCTNCSSSNICGSCLKDWFIDACRNESKMPPKCCQIIPFSTVSTLLSAAQIELYKAKFEEWNTPDRLYCPVPTCSTFIPPRLYSEPPNPITTKFGRWPVPNHRDLKRDLPAIQTPPFPFPKVAHDSTAAPLEIKRDVRCPKCDTKICTTCRSYLHTGGCPPSDLDPELEIHLKRWKIKRCPKCRTGVRKVFGCAHVECRCGAHFCWECLKPMNICDGGCDDEESETESQVQEYDEDDLDGRAGFHENDGHDFGAEPYGNPLEQWACPGHVWHPLRPHPVRGMALGSVDCHNCFKTMKLVNPDKPVSKDSDLPMAGSTTEPGWPSNIYGEPAWQCVEGHLRCERCSKLPPLGRMKDETWEIRCGCGTECEKCAAKKNEHDEELTWECDCGMVVCGECKVSAPARNQGTGAWAGIGPRTAGREGEAVFRRGFP